MNDIIRKAIAICEQFRDGSITRKQWAKQITSIHNDDCNAEPDSFAWILCDCRHLLPEADWDWLFDEYQETEAIDDGSEQLSLLL
jgi:hypothetical protein